MATRRLFPKLILGLAAVGVVGGLVYAYREGKNFVRYVEQEDGTAYFPDIPHQGAKLMVANYNPGAPLAMNLREALEAVAKEHPEIYVIAVESEMEVGGWGSLAAGLAGAPSERFATTWGPHASADDMATDVETAVHALLTEEASLPLSGTLAESVEIE